MPIAFQVFEDLGYYQTTYAGRTTGGELVVRYTAFVESGGFRPGMKELVHLGGADLGAMDMEGLRRVVSFAHGVLADLKLDPMRVAIFAPGDLNYGVSRMYEGLSDGGVQQVRVFRELEEAKLWLLSQEETVVVSHRAR